MLMTGYYQANNSINVYSMNTRLGPKQMVWYWCPNIVTKKTVVVSGTDIVARWKLTTKPCVLTVYQEGGESLCFNDIHPEFTEVGSIIAKWRIYFKQSKQKA